MHSQELQKSILVFSSDMYFGEITFYYSVGDLPDSQMSWQTPASNLVPDTRGLGVVKLISTYTGSTETFRGSRAGWLLIYRHL